MSNVILRIQDREGRGPYRPGFSCRWSDPDGPDCPPWWIEIGIDMASALAGMSDQFHWGCGFRTNDQLNSWFTEREQVKLGRLGFMLVTIIPDTVLVDTARQVVFGTRRPLSKAPMCWIKLGTAAARNAA